MVYSIFILNDLDFVANRGASCGPVNVMLESDGKSLKVGEILLEDLQVLRVSLKCIYSL